MAGPRRGHLPPRSEPRHVSLRPSGFSSCQCVTWLKLDLLRFLPAYAHAGFRDPFDVVQTVTLDNPRYRILGVPLM